MMPSHIIISPGPGPEGRRDLNRCDQIDGDDRFWGLSRPQAIFEAFGGKIIRAGARTETLILIRKRSRSGAVPDFRTFRKDRAARYHSLAGDPETLPEELIVTCAAPDGTVMGIMHRVQPVYGIQFHPESI